MCSRKCCCFTSFFLLLLFSVALFAGLFYGTPIVREFVQAQIDATRVLVNETNPLFQSTWVSNVPNGSTAEYLTFWLWNVTNPKEIEDGGKPKLQQVGPIRYRDFTEKFEIVWESDNELISSFTWEYYIYDGVDIYCENKEKCVEMDQATPSTEITVLNIPFAAVLNQVSAGEDWYTALVVDFLMSASNSSLFMNLKIEELLWGGHEYSLLKLVNDTLVPGTPTEFSLQTNQTDREASRKANNNLKDQWNTGKSNITEVGQYTKWKGFPQQEVWGSKEANLITGTDGTGFRPNLLEYEGDLVSFVPSAFRTTVLEKNEEVEVHGITLYKYILAESNLVNSSIDPAYFLNAPPGLLNLTNPMNGTPVFVSGPLFYQADDFYKRAIDFDVSINKSIHETHLDVEPISGMVMNAAKRLQINILVRPTLVLFPKLKETFFPIAWFEQSGTIGADDAEKFKGQVYFILDVLKYGQYIMYSVSGLFILLGILFLVIGILSKNRTHHDAYNIIPGRINRSPYE